MWCSLMILKHDHKLSLYQAPKLKWWLALQLHYLWKWYCSMLRLSLVTIWGHEMVMSWNSSVVCSWWGGRLLICNSRKLTWLAQATQERRTYYLQSMIVDSRPHLMDLSDLTYEWLCLLNTPIVIMESFNQASRILLHPPCLVLLNLMPSNMW